MRLCGVKCLGVNSETIKRYHCLRAFPVRSKANLYEAIMTSLLYRGNKVVP